MNEALSNANNGDITFADKSQTWQCLSLVFTDFIASISKESQNTKQEVGLNKENSSHYRKKKNKDLDLEISKHRDVEEKENPTINPSFMVQGKVI